MIKELQSKDLRVGNIISCNGIVSEVIRVDWMDCIEAYGDDVFFSEDRQKFEPIELSQEICLKHPNFKHWEDSSYQYDIFENEYGFNFVIDLHEEDGRLIRITKKIKYLHEWQNIYFALTDKELEVEALYKP